MVRGVLKHCFSSVAAVFCSETEVQKRPLEDESLTDTVFILDLL